MSQRVAVVTGAASGIGRASAARLAKEGYGVVLADVNAVGLEAASAQIEADGGTVAYVAGDVREPSSSDELVQMAVSRFGGLDVLVCAAGVSSRTSLEDTSDAEWDRVLSVNLTGAFRCCRAAIPELRKRGGGSIVIVASVWGLVAGPRTVAYAAAKGGLVNLARAIAIDHGPEGIRANVICPGDIDTPLMRQEMQLVGIDPDTGAAESAAGRPMRRLGQPADVADLVSYLASPNSSYMTGSTLVLDGGWLAGG